MPSTQPAWQQLLDDAKGTDARALEAILRLHEQGLSIQQLASELGVAEIDIARALHEARLRRGTD